MCKKGYGLNSLSKTHLISKNSVDSLIVKIIKPLKTFDLICFQVTQKYFGRLYNFAISSSCIQSFLFKVIFVDLISIMVVEVIQSLSVLIDHAGDMYSCGPLININPLNWGLSLLFLLHKILRNTQFSGHEMGINF